MSFSKHLVQQILRSRTSTPWGLGWPQRLHSVRLGKFTLPQCKHCQFPFSPGIQLDGVWGGSSVLEKHVFTSLFPFLTQFETCLNSGRLKMLLFFQMNHFSIAIKRHFKKQVETKNTSFQLSRHPIHLVKPYNTPACSGCLSFQRLTGPTTIAGKTNSVVHLKRQNQWKNTCFFTFVSMKNTGWSARKDRKHFGFCLEHFGTILGDWQSKRTPCLTYSYSRKHWHHSPEHDGSQSRFHLLYAGGTSR